MKQKQHIQPNDHLFYIIGISITIILFMVFVIPLAHAENTKHITIEWSEACLALIELGDLETCGDPNLIKSAYPQAQLKPNYQKMFDDSAKLEKTKYQINDAVLNHKKSCVKADYCNVFDNYDSKIYYWYDPDQSIAGYYDKRITINTNMKHTNLNIQNDQVFDNGTSRSLILDTNQINIRSCQIVAYTPENHRMLLEMGGLMWHLLTDCTDINRLGILKTPYIEELQKKPYDPRDSPNWQILQELEALKEKYKENRLGKD